MDAGAVIAGLAAFAAKGDVHCRMTFTHSTVAVYAEAASDSSLSGARQDPDRLRRDDGPCASGLSGMFPRPGACARRRIVYGGRDYGFRTF